MTESAWGEDAIWEKRGELELLSLFFLYHPKHTPPLKTHAGTPQPLGTRLSPGSLLPQVAHPPDAGPHTQHIRATPRPWIRLRLTLGGGGETPATSSSPHSLLEV